LSIFDRSSAFLLSLLITVTGSATFSSGFSPHWPRGSFKGRPRRDLTCSIRTFSCPCLSISLFPRDLDKSPVPNNQAIFGGIPRSCCRFFFFFSAGKPLWFLVRVLVTEPAFFCLLVGSSSTSTPCVGISRVSYLEFLTPQDTPPAIDGSSSSADRFPPFRGLQVSQWTVDTARVLPLGRREVISSMG